MSGPPFSIAYCTNIWTPHQAPISLELSRLLGEDRFKLYLFEQVHEERQRLGWSSRVPTHKWIIGPPGSQKELESLTRQVCAADVAVLGSCPQEVQAARTTTGKLTLIMSERVLKKPFYRWRMINPRFKRGINRYRKIANRENVHYLAIGAYAAEDVRQIGAFGERVWTWAYFVDVPSSPPQPRAQSLLQILWVGRMLKWKRVDMLLKAIANIYHEPQFGKLDIVGDGPEKPHLLDLSRTLGLGEKCTFHEPMPTCGIREMMRQADVYVLPSNRYEGWGVVANEAMSEGAVLVANDQAGAAQVLVEHERTGFLFKDGDINALESALCTLLHDASLRETIRQAAWRKLRDLWHPRIGAERLVALCQGLLGLAPTPAFREGPCCRCLQD